MSFGNFSSAVRACLCALIALFPLIIAAAAAQTHEHKLANGQFVDNAPAAVVDKEREKLRAVTQELAQLQEQLTRLARIG